MNAEDSTLTSRLLDSSHQPKQDNRHSCSNASSRNIKPDVIYATDDNIRVMKEAQRLWMVYWCGTLLVGWWLRYLPFFKEKLTVPDAKGGEGTALQRFWGHANRLWCDVANIAWILYLFCSSGARRQVWGFQVWFYLLMQAACTMFGVLARLRVPAKIDELRKTKLCLLMPEFEKIADVSTPLDSDYPPSMACVDLVAWDDDKAMLVKMISKLGRLSKLRMTGCLDAFTYSFAAFIAGGMLYGHITTPRGEVLLGLAFLIFATLAVKRAVDSAFMSRFLTQKKVQLREFMVSPESLTTLARKQINAIPAPLGLSWQSVDEARRIAHQHKKDTSGVAVAQDGNSLNTKNGQELPLDIQFVQFLKKLSGLLKMESTLVLDEQLVNKYARLATASFSTLTIDNPSSADIKAFPGYVDAMGTGQITALLLTQHLITMQPDANQWQRWIARPIAILWCLLPAIVRGGGFKTEIDDLSSSNATALLSNASLWANVSDLPSASSLFGNMTSVFFQNSTSTVIVEVGSHLQSFKLVGTLVFPWSYSPVYPSAVWIEIIWMTFGTTLFVRFFIGAPSLLLWLFNKHLKIHTSLLKMLSGPQKASKYSLPHVDVRDPDQLLVWSEVRSMVLRATEIRQSFLEEMVLFAFLLVLVVFVTMGLEFHRNLTSETSLLVGCCLCMLWEIVVYFIPVFWVGLQVNQVVDAQISTLTNHIHEIAICENYAHNGKDPDEASKLGRARSLATSMKDSLSKAKVRLFGYEVTRATLASLASFTYFAVSNMTPIVKQSLVAQ